MFWEVDGRIGEFWTIRHFEAGVPFRFSPVRNWEVGGFHRLDENTGEGTYFEFRGGNIEMLATGIYMVHIDIRNDRLLIEPARVYLIGDVMNNNWNAENPAHLFTASGTTLVSPIFVDSGYLRMFAASSIAGASDW